MIESCYFCDATEEIEEHHILPQRFDGNDLPTNTVDLCHDCHWKLERLYNKDFWESIGVDDPRATKESHVICSINGCLDNSVGLFSVQKGTNVPRCEQHKPVSDDEPDPSDLSKIEKLAFGGVEKTTKTGRSKYD